MQGTMDRCAQCRKRKTMLFECKCGKTLCLKHLHASSHSCDFDYHQEQKCALTKTVVEVKTDKVARLESFVG